MTRLYIQPSWIDSCSDHGEWSGGNGQYRGDKSIEAVPTYINGKPNINAFSDAAIESRREKRKTSVPLKQRILPQSARVEKLNAEILELESAYRAGEFSPEEYTLLRDVAFKKRNRAEELLKKAITIKPPVEDWEDSYEDTYTQPSYSEQTAYYTEDSTYTNDDRVQGDDSTWVEPLQASWLDRISDSNSLKIPIKKACTFIKTVVYLSQKARNYINELKAV